MSIDTADVQGIVLQGYGRRYTCARHFFLGIGTGAGARAFVGELVDGDRDSGLEVRTGARWEQGEEPATCVNVGITWLGLQALGVPSAVLNQFPPAFQQGPAARAQIAEGDDVGLGDVGESAPERWIMGGPATLTVHMIVSLYAQDPADREHVTGALRDAFTKYRLIERSHRDAARLSRPDYVHFGYRDGIGQPRIDGGFGNERPDMQPDMPVGDLLLGCDYRNSFEGNYAGDLPAGLVDNATYGAFRILRQDVVAFERLLFEWGQAASMDPELVAAKLVGRWRNGVPLALSPSSDSLLAEIRMDDFDYVTGANADPLGLRCPIGAHARRLNPRGAVVMGKPHSRRLVRRNMPYGPDFEPNRPDDEERGLVGYFLCGDLENQWEFIQDVWVNEDLATHGLRGTREPIGGAQPGDDGSFTIRTEDERDPIRLTGLPNLVQTRGSAYCLLPGIGGLRHLASLPDPNGVTA
jgi:deferrochelatase/peroxidase EfeB